MKKFIGKRPILVLVLACSLYYLLREIFTSNLIQNLMFWGLGGFIIFWSFNINLRELIAKKTVFSLIPAIIMALWLGKAAILFNRNSDVLFIFLFALPIIFWGWLFFNLVMKQFIKKRPWLTSTLALIIVFIFYNYLYVPIVISSCQGIAVNLAAKQYKNSHPEDNEGTYLNANYEHYYLHCLRERGIHKL